eukprot:11109790-Lingulodinium_polyedra.AAC.1
MPSTRHQPRLRCQQDMTKRDIDKTKQDKTSPDWARLEQTRPNEARLGQTRLHCRLERHSTVDSSRPHCQRPDLTTLK